MFLGNMKNHEKNDSLDQIDYSDSNICEFPQDNI